MQRKKMNALIHRGLVEIGLLIPITAEEVAWAEKAMEGREIELPEALKEPPIHLLERIRNDASRKRRTVF